MGKRRRTWRIYGFRGSKSKPFGLGLTTTKSKTNAAKVASARARKAGFKMFGIGPQY